MSAKGDALRAADAAAVGRFDLATETTDAQPTPVVAALVVEPDPRTVRAPEKATPPKVTVLLTQDVR